MSVRVGCQPRWGEIADKWPRIIQKWLYPPTCVLCGDPGHEGRDLCQPCRDDLPYLANTCPRCAHPLATAVCRPCQDHPPAFDAAHAALRYATTNAAGYLVQALKFHRHYPCARVLGELLADSLADRTHRPEVLLPVPLHASRYRERGFNQSAEIARVVSQRLGIPRDLAACHRIRATAAQAGLSSAGERRLNLQGAFAVAAGVAYRHVALIDDVMTTGSTVNELARVLRRADVEHIEVWTVARAVQI